MKLKALTLIIALLSLFPVHAYIGPAAGIPVIGSIIGVIVTIFVVIGAILFWPIRKMLKNKKKASRINI